MSPRKIDNQHRCRPRRPCGAAASMLVLCTAALAFSFSSSAVILVSSFSMPQFAISSSNSPKKRNKFKTNDKSSAGGGGFSRKKKTDSVPISHAPDESIATRKLVNFLLSWKAEGLAVGSVDEDEDHVDEDDSSGGTEVGYDLTSGLRGMYASKSFQKGDILCKIPSDCALALSDPNNAGGAEDPKTVSEGGLNFLNWYASNESAKVTWAAYLDTLPTRDSNFDPTPDFYTDGEIDALEFPLAVRMARDRKRELLDASEKERIAVEDLQFATWIVSSRSFLIKMSVDDPMVRESAEGAAQTTTTQEKAIRILLPYLDMINHSSDRFNTELHLIDPEKDEAWFAIRATRPIPKGKELTISYGATGVESSIELLMNYGFVPDENRIDELVVKSMVNKGGEGCIERLDGWTTTLEEDEAALLELEQSGGDGGGNMKNVLRLRTKLKKSYPAE